MAIIAAAVLASWTGAAARTMYSVQATDYYPYGMPMATSTGAEVNRYKYSGKELETRNGLNHYDFDARLQFPAINLFNQTDVNAGDYPWLNPYLYCAANPIANIDPTGQDIWYINQNGKIVDTDEEYKEYDKVVIVNDEGKPVMTTDEDGNETELSVQFAYGTLEHSTGSYSNMKSVNNGNMTGEYDIFKVKGDSKTKSDHCGTKLFELLSKGVTAKSGNEIGLIRTGVVGKGTNYITSAKQHKAEPGGPALFHSQLKNGYVTREFTHSHIENATPSSSDVASHKEILGKYNHSNSIRFKIYLSTTGSYFLYDPITYVAKPNSKK